MNPLELHMNIPQPKAPIQKIPEQNPKISYRIEQSHLSL